MTFATRMLTLIPLFVVVSAHAQDAPLATAATASLPAETAFRPVCVEGMCLEVVSAPILELDALDGEVSWMDEAPRLWRPQAPAPARLGFSSGTETEGGATVLGEIRANRESLGSDYLGEASSAMPTNIGDVDPVDGVTGLGFVSKF